MAYLPDSSVRHIAGTSLHEPVSAFLFLYINPDIAEEDHTDCADGQTIFSRTMVG